MCSEEIFYVPHIPLDSLTCGTYHPFMDEDTIRAAMAELARRRWAKATDADRAGAAKKMVAGRRKARKRRQSKVKQGETK